MQKLNITDAAFLYAETPRTPMHIASVQLLALPPDMPADDWIRSLRTHIAGRLDRVPYLTRRLHDTPWQLDHPNWVQTSHIDLNRHIYRVNVPAPGSRTELEATIANLHARPLDRDRPLWDMAILCGLADGRVACYSRVHHACADGMAGQEAIRLLMDTSPVAPVAAALPELRDESPTHVQSITSALENITRAQTDYLLALPRMLEAWQHLQERWMSAEHQWNGGIGLAPATPLNRAVGVRRTVAVGEFPLADIKAIASFAGASVNDVVLALCGGGLRSYLKRMDLLPKPSLLAGCPVSLRAPGDSRANNQLSMMRVSLGTHIANPMERLLHIKTTSRQAKKLTAESLALTRHPIAAPGLPWLMQMNALGTGWLATGNTQMPTPVNVVISNVPGPKRTLYFNGARMLTHYPVSIPTHGLGVNITAQCYADTLFFGITACARALPDPRTLMDDLTTTCQALLELVSHPTVANPAIEVTAPLTREAA